MATMNVSLSPEMLAFVTHLTQSGRYASASDVVRDGLRLLEQEKAAEAEKLDALRREIEVGLSDLGSDRLTRRTAADIARDVIRNAGRAP
ncbi:type II toxin-antitoxin system ParD family antitoxin [Methylobacterium sp. J-076]|nr:type II toxin-antitoxin system ParD family antitoxin [Methylobacterium sp. J-076]